MTAHPHSLFFCDIDNFGDRLNLDLLRYYDLPVTPFSMEHTVDIHESGLFAIGSVLDRASDFFTGIVAGAGFMSERTRKSFYYADVMAVRGRYTAERILSHASIPMLLDPGILISRIFPTSEKKYKLGIVPHYIDATDERIRKLREHHPEDILVIDVTQSPRQVAADISSCLNIASSSLHGIVTADSYEIPSVWLKLSEAMGGGEFKFHDYRSAYSMTAAPYTGTYTEMDSLLQACTRPPSGIAGKMEAADSLFQELRGKCERPFSDKGFRKTASYWNRRLLRKYFLLRRSFDK